MKNVDLLLMMQRLKGANGLREKDLMNVVSNRHLHSIQRGAYKPKGSEYVLSVRIEENSRTYGRQIFWQERAEGDFERIEMAPPSGESDALKDSDIKAMESNLRDAIPVGVFERNADKSSRCLGLAKIIGQTEDGRFILVPTVLGEEVAFMPTFRKNYFSFKTSDPLFVGKWLALTASGEGDGSLDFENLYQHENELELGSIVFLVFGGDRVDWDKGLVGICSIVKGPHERGYVRDDPKKFKVQLQPRVVFPRAISKQDFKQFPESFDIPFITPSTKGEVNQAKALLSLEGVTALAIRLCEFFPSLRQEILNCLDINLPAVLPRNSAGGSSLIISSTVPQNTMPLNLPRNRILYGPPGTGKSYFLEDEIRRYFPDELLRCRITLYPSLGYHDLVGAYRPVPMYRSQDDATFFGSDKVTVAEHQFEPLIDYSLTPGPLLEVWTKALLNPKHNFVLVIEELNRTNVAAAFGDTFQLLDRIPSGPSCGASVYPIRMNQEIMHWFRMHGIQADKIGFPPNLYLWATMNSADQGVQVLDSAFKRRWSFRFVGLNEHEHIVDGWEIELRFLSKRVRWNTFRRVINRRLLDLNVKEDRLLGPFFLAEEDLADGNAFEHKILLYLKEDVMRYGSGLFLKSSLSDILSDYSKGERIFDIDSREFVNEGS